MATYVAKAPSTLLPPPTPRCLLNPFRGYEKKSNNSLPAASFEQSLPFFFARRGPLAFFFEHLLFDDHRETEQKGSMLLAEEFGEATLRKSLNDFSHQYDAGGLKSYPALFGAPLPAI